MSPETETLIADNGFDSDALQEALAERDITPCTPPRAKRRFPARYSKTSYRQRHKVETMFATLKDRRRVSMRYGRCARAFFSAIRVAATVVFRFAE